MAGKKAMLEVSKKPMTSALSAEHQRKWDKTQWENKLKDPERNYDKSRAHLNFEIRKGGKIASIDQKVDITDKVNKRIEEWKAVRLAATGKLPILRSTQHKSVSLILGGNRERMNELAFGKQVLKERGHNSHIKRMPDIEQYALDNYHALAKKIGEENIVSFIVHCDETNCHIHATIIPILTDGRLSAKDMFGGGSLKDASNKMREWHDWYASINEKWGLERGEDIHETGAKHRNLHEYSRSLLREIDKMEALKNEQQKTLDKINNDIKHAKKRVKGLNSMISNDEKRIYSIQAELDSLRKQLEEGNEENAELKARINCRKDELSVLNEKVSNRKEELHISETTLDALCSSRQNLEMEISSYDRKLEHLKEECAEEEAKRESANEGKATILGFFNRGELKKARDELSDREEEIKKLKKQITELQLSHEKTLADMRKEIEQIKADHASGMAEITQKLHKTEGERDSLKQENEQLRHKIKEQDKVIHPEKYRLSSGAELLGYFIPTVCTLL